MVEFDWDEANLEHSGRHGVEPDEAEAVLLSRTRVLLERVIVTGELRYTFIDRLADGQGFCVVVMVNRGRKYRVVTARRPSQDEVKRWRRARR